MSRKTVWTVAFSATVLVFHASVLCQSGTSGPAAWVCSTTTGVKPDKVKTFERYVKELREQYKRAGVSWFTTFQTYAGDTTEFTTLVPVARFGDLDHVADPVRDHLSQRMVRCYLHQAREFDTPQVDLDLHTSTRPPAQYWVATSTQVAAGKMNEYLNWLKDDYRPALEKAGVEQFKALRPIFGSATGEVVTMRMLKNLAEVDNGAILSKVLTEQEVRAMTAKVIPLVTSSSTRIMRLRRDLSYSATW